MQLTPHFSLEEMTFSETARRFGIDNTPPDDVIGHLAVVAHELERVREVLDGHPIIVTSGYRCAEVNRRIGSKDTSAHVLGWAADFRCPGYGNPLAVAKAIANAAPGIGLAFDQLIHEYRAWVHISFNPAHRRQLLTIDERGTRWGLD